MARGARTGFWLALAGALALWSRTKQGQEVTAQIVDFVAGLPRGIRNHNPGNIERTGTQWQGMAADQSADPRFVVFVAPEWGLRAMVRILRNYAARGLRSIREIVGTWAPTAENDTAAYVRAVSQSVGVDPDQPLDLFGVDAARLPNVLAAIVHHENGMQPYAPDVFWRAIELERTA